VRGRGAAPASRELVQRYNPRINGRFFSDGRIVQGAEDQEEKWLGKMICKNTGDLFRSVKAHDNRIFHRASNPVRWNILIPY
jgi:hypothetical protein